ncbi:MAG: hypothetical protein KA717_28125 [Woronichinia naegeliana WA131]|uniref:Uncharacterized protein n=1 Tax=Woronichinia naegeliana WA131 TaxID=2824559 RepID=A0A977KTH7_9CYAN|nr:MAG: hypothetical protein KA717_28125 [Woronichinia naegeliana WA131]
MHPASASEGWTIVLMDRASRFIWHLKCGRKEQKLFLEAMMTVTELFERSAESLQLFTDGEKRYSQLLFNICHEVLELVSSDQSWKKLWCKALRK